MSPPAIVLLIYFRRSINRAGPCALLSRRPLDSILFQRNERSFGNVNPGLRVPLFFDANCGREGEKNSLTVCSPELHACRYRKCGSRCITWHNLIDLRSSLENLFYVCESTSCVGCFFFTNHPCIEFER